MPELKSVSSGGKDKRREVALRSYNELLTHFPQKMYWFLSQKEPYRPHEWQAAFHSANLNGRMLRFRHLVAGRRGGKTLSAAWEVVFYCLHPEVFHMDAHGRESDRALWVWVLAKDHEVGFASRQAVLQVLDDAGMEPNKDYRYNKTEKKIDFENGTLLQFKSADDPQSLRGAGLDILWIDEAAFVPNRDAWDVVRPSLSDKLGRVITTTTPHGKNWFHEEFWGKEAISDDNQFRVEYTTLDNFHVPRDEWLYAKNHLHPMIFKQEYMASFDAMSGIALSGDWLKYFSVGDPGPGEIRLPRDENGDVKLRKFIGVDPAISLSDAADSFAMALIGITEDNTQGFVLATYKAKIQFPEQVDKIREWFLQYRPELIGVESVAYQRALAQMANRIEGMPGIVPVMTKAKKTDRILGLGPLFKIGKVRIPKVKNEDFIDEWVSYDPGVKNPRDDLLDAVEIALGVAGVLLPTTSFNGPDFDDLPTGMTLTEEAALQLREHKNIFASDPELGDMA